MSSVIETAGTRVSGCVSLAPELVKIRRAASSVAGDNKRKGTTPMNYRLQIHGDHPTKIGPLIPQAGFFDTRLKRFTSLMQTGGYDEQGPPG